RDGGPGAGRGSAAAAGHPDPRPACPDAAAAAAAAAPRDAAAAADGAWEPAGAAWAAAPAWDPDGASGGPAPARRCPPCPHPDGGTPHAAAPWGTAARRPCHRTAAWNRPRKPLEAYGPPAPRSSKTPNARTRPFPGAWP